MSDKLHNTFILTAQSERIQLRTAYPPDPASNLGVIATTCSAIQVGWDPPREHGVDVIGKGFSFFVQHHLPCSHIL